MKYISIDLETSGLNPERDQILQFAAVIENTKEKTAVNKLPKFNKIIFCGRVNGQPYALNMNKHIIEQIAEEEIRMKKIKLNNENMVCNENMTDISHLEKEFIKFLKENGYKENDYNQISVTAAGKNFDNFDRKFIEKKFERVKFRHRSIDPAVLYMQDSDEELPDLQTCLNRAEIKKEVTHDALDDACDVVKLIRGKI